MAPAIRLAFAILACLSASVVLASIRVDEIAGQDELLQFRGLDDGALLCPSEYPGEPTTALTLASMFNGLLSVAIDWGDGTPKEHHRSIVGAFSFVNFDHAYTKGGMYAVAATARLRRLKDDESGEFATIGKEYRTHVGVRESCDKNAFFGFVSVNCEAIPSDTSDQFFLAKVCFSPQTEQVLDYSIDWGLGPMDMYIGRVFEVGQMVCHSRMYKERGRHILQVQVENSDGSTGTKSSDVVLRQRISTTATSCIIGDYEPHLRRL